MEGGILEVLKNGPEEDSAAASMQRVAFVGQAEVKETRGKVERLTGIEKWDTLPQGTTLYPGDIIRSHAGSSALLQMLDSGSLVQVTSQTVVRMTAMKPDWDRAALTGTQSEEGFAVRSIRGRAYYHAGEAGWQPLRVTTVLSPRTLVRTAAGSSMDLFDTRTGRFVRVEGSTQALLNETLTASRRYENPSLAASSAPGR